MLAMGGRRLVAASAFLAAALTGCGAAPETESPERPTAAASSSSRSSGSTEAGKSPDRPGRTRVTPGVKGGARFEVPDAVILEQLRRAAERIAQNYTAPPTPTPVGIDPGTNRALGYQLLLDFGFAEEQWRYLDALWQRESGWNHLAENPSSGAYGIPQSLPAIKMAVVGDDWRTNPDTQIRWGLAYIAARYGTPERAWAHSERFNWY
jgi:hypothetical protein